MEHIAKKYLNKNFYATDENNSKLYLIKANNEQGEEVGKIDDGEIYFLYGYIMTELNSRLLGSIMSVVEIKK